MTSNFNPSGKNMSTFSASSRQLALLTIASSSSSLRLTPKPTPPRRPSTSRNPTTPLPPTERPSACPPAPTRTAKRVAFKTAFPSNPTVAIIGGGLSGLICALELAKRGIRSTVFDTGEHGPGGRLATRSAGDGSLRRRGPSFVDSRLVFDHAAQFWTASHPKFQALVEEWEAAGAVQRWEGATVGNLRVGGHYTALSPQQEGEVRYIGVGGMRQLAEFLCAAAEETGVVEVQRPVWVGSMRADSSGWKVSGRGRNCGHFSAVVIAHNGKCANRLTSPAGVPAIHSQLRRLKLSACWVLMAGFNGAVLPAKLSSSSTSSPPAVQGAFVRGSDVLSWVANNTTKLGLVQHEGDAASALESWSLLSTQSYGKLNKAPQEALPADIVARVTEEMLDAFSAALGVPRSALPEASFLKAQLWGAALPLNSPGVDCIWDAEGRVGVVGDWVRGGGCIENAALSGAALAECIAERPGQSCGLEAPFSRVGGEDIGLFPVAAAKEKVFTAVAL